MKSDSAMNFVAAAIAVCLAASPARALDSTFVSGKAGFSVKFGDITIPYSIMSVCTMPSEELVFEIVDGNKAADYEAVADSGRLVELPDCHWLWQAPAGNGQFRIKIFSPGRSDSIRLNVFVLVPYDRLKGEYLNGYRIGKYPGIPFKMLPTYNRPRGFIEITEANIDLQISPHFQLRQFVCKQKSNYPKYVIIREKLLLKLELILEKVNEQGHPCSSFNILSGYRTPYYNKSIDNVKYSRHLWGGAADIFIDENPRDGMMDDLNKDGKINWRDAAVLYDIIDSMYGHPLYEALVGGLARYKKTSKHGPFVHVDVRGRRARWGD